MRKVKNKKQKLIESFQKDWKSDVSPEKISLNEKNRHITLQESKYDALAAYKLPIWKLGEKNFNERIYPKSLGEKIVKENKVTVVLDNHPTDKDDPGIKEIIAVGKNPSIEGNILYAECYFVDKELSEKVERATDLGFFFEQSSSGYGELDENGIVVAETYDLERYFDLLLSDSSYNVSFGDKNKLNTEKIKEKVSNKEIKIMDNKKVISKEDKLIRLGLENKLREASKIEDLKERYIEYNSVMGYFEDFNNEEYASDLKETVEKELLTIQEKIDALTEKGKKLDKVEEEKENSIKSLEEANEALKTLKEEKELIEAKLGKAIEELDEGKKLYLTLKDLYENKVAELNTMVDPEDYLLLVKEFDKVVEANKDGKGSDSDKKGIPAKDGAGPHGKGDGPGKGKADGTGMKKESSFKLIKKAIEDTKVVYEKKHPDLNIELQSEEIVDYYNDLVSRYGESIKDFKDSFLATSTITEAQELYFKLRPVLNERTSMPTASRRGIIDRTNGETRKKYYEKHNLIEKGSLARLKPDSSWI